MNKSKVKTVELRGPFNQKTMLFRNVKKRSESMSLKRMQMCYVILYDIKKWMDISQMRVVTEFFTHTVPRSLSKTNCRKKLQFESPHENSGVKARDSSKMYRKSSIHSQICKKKIHLDNDDSSSLFQKSQKSNSVRALQEKQERTQHLKKIPKNEKRSINNVSRDIQKLPKRSSLQPTGKGRKLIDSSWMSSGVLKSEAKSYNVDSISSSLKDFQSQNLISVPHFLSKHKSNSQQNENTSIIISADTTKKNKDDTPPKTFEYYHTAGTSQIHQKTRKISSCIQKETDELPLSLFIGTKPKLTRKVKRSLLNSKCLKVDDKDSLRKAKVPSNFGSLKKKEKTDEVAKQSEVTVKYDESNESIVSADISNDVHLSAEKISDSSTYFPLHSTKKISYSSGFKNLSDTQQLCSFTKEKTIESNTLKDIESLSTDTKCSTQFFGAFQDGTSLVKHSEGCQNENICTLKSNETIVNRNNERESEKLTESDEKSDILQQLIADVGINERDVVVTENEINHNSSDVDFYLNVNGQKVSLLDPLQTTVNETPSAQKLKKPNSFGIKESCSENSNDMCIEHLKTKKKRLRKKCNVISRKLVNNNSIINKDDLHKVNHKEENLKLKKMRSKFREKAKSKIKKDNSKTLEVTQYRRNCVRKKEDMVNNECDNQAPLSNMLVESSNVNVRNKCNDKGVQNYTLMDGQNTEFFSENKGYILTKYMNSIQGQQLDKLIDEVQLEYNTNDNTTANLDMPIISMSHDEEEAKEEEEIVEISKPTKHENKKLPTIVEDKIVHTKLFHSLRSVRDDEQDENMKNSNVENMMPNLGNENLKSEAQTVNVNQTELNEIDDEILNIYSEENLVSIEEELAKIFDQTSVNFADKFDKDTDLKVSKVHSSDESNLNLLSQFTSDKVCTELQPENKQPNGNTSSSNSNMLNNVESVPLTTEEAVLDLTETNIHKIFNSLSEVDQIVNDAESFYKFGEVTSICSDATKKLEQKIDLSSSESFDHQSINVQRKRQWLLHSDEESKFSKQAVKRRKLNRNFKITSSDKSNQELQTNSSDMASTVKISENYKILKVENTNELRHMASTRDLSNDLRNIQSIEAESAFGICERNILWNDLQADSKLCHSDVFKNESIIPLDDNTDVLKDNKQQPIYSLGNEDFKQNILKDITLKDESNEQSSPEDDVISLYADSNMLDTLTFESPKHSPREILKPRNFYAFSKQSTVTVNDEGEYLKNPSKPYENFLNAYVESIYNTEQCQTELKNVYFSSPIKKDPQTQNPDMSKLNCMFPAVDSYSQSLKYESSENVVHSKKNVHSRLGPICIDTDNILNGQCFSLLNKGICTKLNCSYEHNIKIHLKELHKQPSDVIFAVAKRAIELNLKNYIKNMSYKILASLDYKNAMKFFALLTDSNMAETLNVLKTIIDIILRKEVSLNTLINDMMCAIKETNVKIRQNLFAVIEKKIKPGYYWETFRNYFKATIPSANQLDSILKDCIYTNREKYYIKDICNYLYYLKYDLNYTLHCNVHIKNQFLNVLRKENLHSYLRIFGIEENTSEVTQISSPDKLHSNISERQIDESSVAPFVVKQNVNDSLHRCNEFQTTYESRQVFVNSKEQQKIDFEEHGSSKMQWKLQLIDNISEPGSRYHDMFYDLNYNLLNMQVSLKKQDYKTIVNILLQYSGSNKTCYEKACYNKCLQLLRNFERNSNSAKNVITGVHIPDNFWTFVEDVKHVNEYLAVGEFMQVLDIFKRYASEANKRNWLITACYQILREEIKLTENYFSLVQLYAVQTKANDVLKKMLIDLALYILLDFANNNRWLVAYNYLKYLKKFEWECNAAVTLFKAEIFIASRRPDKALILLKRTNVIFRNRKRWLVENDPTDEPFRMSVVDVLLRTLCVEHINEAFFLFELLLIDQQHIIYPMDLTRYVDKLMYKLIEKKDMNNVIKLSRLILKYCFALQKFTFRLAIIHLVRCDIYLARQLFQYAANLGVYNTLKQRGIDFHYITQIIHVDMLEEELYLIFLEMTRYILLNIGHALDRLKPNNLHIYIILEDVPSERQLYFDDTRDFNETQTRLRYTKKLIANVLANRFYPVIKISSYRKAPRVLKLVSSSVVEHLKSGFLVNEM